MARAFNPANFGGDAAVTMTAAGTATGTAATVTADHVLVTVSTSTDSGVILRALNAGEICSVGNGDATEVVNVYPPSGAKLNNQTADLPYVLPQGKAALFIFLNATNILAIGG